MTDGGGDVVVRVEVRVPLAAAGKQFRVFQVVVNRPTPNGTANVLAASGAGSGSICATGNGAIKNGKLAAFVYAKVYTGTVTNPPNNPPGGTAFTVPTGSDGDWAFALLSGADCNAAGTAPNTLVTWTDFGGPGYEVLTTPFTGKCSDHTDCSSGSGSGTMAPPGVGETAPRQWNVVAEGFGDPCDPFNRLWLLTAAAGAGEPTTWVSEDEGKGRPRVKLHHDRAAGVWRLTFQLGKNVVGYERADGDWRPLNANILEGPAGSAPCESSPEYIAVVPV